MVHKGASPTFDPSVGTFYDPTLRQNSKPSPSLRQSQSSLQGFGSAIARSPHHFDHKRMSVFDRPGTTSSISAVSIELLHIWHLIAGLLNNSRCRITILNISRCDRYGYQYAQGIDDQVALSTLDLFASVKAAFTALRRSTSRLRINDRSAGLDAAAHALAPLFAKAILQLLEGTSLYPACEGFIDGLPRWK